MLPTTLLRRIAGLPLILAAPMALAQATPQGAADLTAVFQTYLGSTPGVVNVIADGDAYLVTLDASPLIARIPAEAGARVTLSPLQVRMTDGGDGTWAYAYDQPLTMTLDVPGQIEMRIAVEAIACTGVFATALLSSRESDCTLTDMSVNQVISDPAGGTSATEYRVASGTYSARAEAAATGGVNATYTLDWQDMVQTMSLPAMAPEAPPQTITVTMDSYVTEGSGAGVRMAPIYDLLAFAVANADPALIEANRAELGRRLTAALPVFDRVGGTVRIAAMRVDTPVGPVTVDRITADIDLTGAVETGLFREALVIEGITPPPGVLPDWALPLLPDDLSLDVTVTGFDPGAGARLAIGLLDLPSGQPVPPEFGPQMLAALLPQGAVDIALAPATAGNAMWRLNYEGGLSVGPGAMPTGQARVTGTGLAQVMATLDDAPQEVRDQALPVLGAAQGLGRAEGDGTLVWEIDATEPGTLKINGMDLMGMQ